MSDISPFYISKHINDQYIAHLSIDYSLVTHNDIITDKFECAVPIDKITLDDSTHTSMVLDNFVRHRAVLYEKQMEVYEFFSKIYMLAYMNNDPIEFVMTTDYDMYFCCSKEMYEEIAPVCNTLLT